MRLTQKNRQEKYNYSRLREKHTLDKDFYAYCNKYYSAQNLSLVTKFITEFFAKNYGNKGYREGHQRNQSRTKQRLPHSVDKLGHCKART